eukprot:m.23350 g.23350  ORF g.23350 m.23350 type:complete len:328 (-) comp8967_c0_seq1:196-1179(-)
MSMLCFVIVIVIVFCLFPLHCVDWEAFLCTVAHRSVVLLCLPDREDVLCVRIIGNKLWDLLIKGSQQLDHEWVLCHHNWPLVVHVHGIRVRTHKTQHHHAVVLIEEGSKVEWSVAFFVLQIAAFWKRLKECAQTLFVSIACRNMEERRALLVERFVEWFSMANFAFYFSQKVILRLLHQLLFICGKSRFFHCTLKHSLCALIICEVNGEIIVCIYKRDICTITKKHHANTRCPGRGGSVERGPPVFVTGVHICSAVQKNLHNPNIILNTRPVEGCHSIRVLVFNVVNVIVQIFFKCVVIFLNNQVHNHLHGLKVDQPLLLVFLHFNI